MTFRVALLAVGVPVVIAGALAYLAIYVSGVYGFALFFAVFDIAPHRHPVADIVGE